MIHTSKKISKLYYIFLLPLILLVFLRPLTFSVGDFLVYYKGSTQIIHGFDLYRISLENFGTRFFNGPIWGYFISPLTILEPKAALIIFRIVSAVLCIFYFPKVLNDSNKDKILYLGIFLLMFPTRMNMNLAQGAAISGSLFLFVILNLKYKKDKLNQILIQSIFMTVAFNYKPLLGSILIIYLLFKRQIRLILLFMTINIAYLIINLYFNKTASYISWFKLMKERNSRIIQVGYENIVGPWAFIARIFRINPMFILLVQLILILFFIAYLYLTRKRKFDVDESVIFLSAGTMVGLYSPAQDSLVLCSYLIFKYYVLLKNKKSFVREKIIFGIILGFWSASTEISIIKSVVIITLECILLLLLKTEIVILFSISLSWLLSQFIIINIKYDHINYDLAGISTLLGISLLFSNLIRSFKNFSSN